LRIFAKNRSEAIRPVVAAGFSPLPHKIFSVASSMRYVKFSEQAPIRALDALWFFAALPRVRARLAELRAARFATPHNLNQQQTRERRARPHPRVKRPAATRAFARGFHQRIGG
jgi:hypothetical protein